MVPKGVELVTIRAQPYEGWEGVCSTNLNQIPARNLSRFAQEFGMFASAKAEGPEGLQAQAIKGLCPPGPLRALAALGAMQRVRTALHVEAL